MMNTTVDHTEVFYGSTADADRIDAQVTLTRSSDRSSDSPCHDEH
jgi:hypothetical protein